MLSMRGMLRFELNSPLEFDNITDDNWDSIYRRSLVIEMKGRFLPSEEYDSLTEDEKATGSIFQKDDTLKSFLEERPAALAFFNIVYAYMNKRTMEESRSTIDSYARTEGTTWRVMRGACRLPLQVPPRKVDRGPEMRQEDRDHMLLAELSVALSILAIESNCEAVVSASSLCSLWK